MRMARTFFWALCFSGIIADVPLWAVSEILLDDYSNGLSNKWEEKSFKGKTHYQVELVDHQMCIKATSRDAASSLYYRITYDLRTYPILKWTWKIDHIISKGDAHRKETDDYPARVYVVFPSLLFWRTRAINYIWANKLPSGRWIPSAYTSNAVMIAVESGASHAGVWREESRNVLEDYRTVFGEDPPEVGAIAIMTDTDNTGEEVSACYGPIRILPAPDS